MPKQLAKLATILLGVMIMTLHPRPAAESEDSNHRAAQSYLDKSRAFIDSRDYPDAVQAAESAIEFDPSGPAYFQLALAKLHNKDQDGAAAAASEALSRGLNPRIALMAHNLRATILLDRQDFSHAKQEADAALAIPVDPGDFEGNLNHSRASMYRDKAIEGLAGFGPRAKTGPAAWLPAWPPERRDLHLWLLTATIVLAIIGASLIGIGLLFGPAPAPSPAPAAGRDKNHGVEAADPGYEFGRIIGQGGMGRVYEANDPSLRRKVAIKELRPELRGNSEARERFLQEARTVALLSHPNIVAIHSVINTPKRTMLIFEYVEGRTMADLIDESPSHRLPLRQVVGITRQVCAALWFAHSKHVIHRDLKPSNIMVEESGRVKVMDFGIARQAKDSMMTVTNTVMGTPFYMAPEMDEGAVGKESDLYSLAVCLYEVLTGSLPFDGPNCQRLKQSGSFKPVTSLEPSLPAKLNAFFERALAPRPHLRYNSARDFLQAFLAAAS